MKSVTCSIAAVLLACLVAGPAAAGPIDPAVQAKVDAQVKAIQAWASDPAIVKAVAAQNASAPAEFAAMTQDRWAAATVLDPFVRQFTKNDAAAVLKAKKSDTYAEIFVSAADGRKVAFLAKTTNWSHKGKPKHDVPMTGKTWQGAIEVDESSGVQSIQVSVPVMDGGKPIGSVVVGLAIAKM